jgi:hypothetical protein
MTPPKVSGASAPAPRVLHIGQRKTATTWLQQAAEDAAAAGVLNLEHWRIAQLKLARKPPDFGREEFARVAEYLPLDRSRPSLATCEDLMVADAEGLAAAVARVWPDARILITTRAPQDYLLSSFNNDSFSGSRSVDDFVAGFTRHHMPRVFDFDRKRAAFEAAFGPGSVHFVPYELLRADPAAYLAEIAAILGVDLAPFVPARPINVSPPPEYLFLQRRVNAMIAAAAPEILASREWRGFIRMANFSAGSARGLEQYFADFFRNAPELAGDLPRLPAAARSRLAAGMQVLRDLPVYQPWLAQYGLSADPAEKAS